MQLFAVVAVAALVAVASAQRDPAKHMEMIKQCMAEEMPPPADLELLKKQQLPIDDKGKCFVGCLFEKAGIFKNGVFQREYTLEMCKKMFANDPAMLEKALATHAICDKEVDTGLQDKCHNGVKLIGCLHKNMPQFNMIPE